MSLDYAVVQCIDHTYIYIYVIQIYIYIYVHMNVQDLGVGLFCPVDFSDIPLLNTLARRRPREVARWHPDKRALIGSSEMSATRHKNQ